MFVATRAIRIGGSDVGRLPGSSAVPLTIAATISYFLET
jgi:hypothetical protein